MGIGYGCVINDLCLVDGGGDRRPIVHEVEFAQDGELQIGVALTLTDPHALGGDGHTAGNDQIDLGHLVGFRRYAVV